MFPRPESQFPTPYTFLSTDFSNFKSEMIYDSTFQREATHTHIHFVTLLLKFLQSVAKKEGRKKGAEKFLIRKTKKTKRNELLLLPPSSYCLLYLFMEYKLYSEFRVRVAVESRWKAAWKRSERGKSMCVCAREKRKSAGSISSLWKKRYRRHS